MIRFSRWMVLLLATIVALGACGGVNVSNNEKIQTILDIPESTWVVFSGKRVYFGHQSVGFNIVAGIEDLAADYPFLRLNLKETADAGAIEGPVFAHSRVGSNQNPRSKNQAFRELLSNGMGATLDLAAYKYCYVDIDDKTDIDAVFAAYRETVAAIHTAWPQLTLVHITVPLREAPVTWKTKIKLLLGKTNLWEFADNVARNRFNQRLLAEYGGREPVFDLARVESTFPDGRRHTFEVGGERFAALVPEYSDDGGHLNPVGRRHVAEQFLIFLATVAE